MITTDGQRLSPDDGLGRRRKEEKCTRIGQLKKCLAVVIFSGKPALTPPLDDRLYFLFRSFICCRLILLRSPLRAIDMDYAH